VYCSYRINTRQHACGVYLRHSADRLDSTLMCSVRNRTYDSPYIDKVMCGGEGFWETNPGLVAGEAEYAGGTPDEWGSRRPLT